MLKVMKADPSARPPLDVLQGLGVAFDDPAYLADALPESLKNPVLCAWEC